MESRPKVLVLAGIGLGSIQQILVVLVLATRTAYGAPPVCGFHRGSGMPDALTEIKCPKTLY